jgi:chitin synthase
LILVQVGCSLAYIARRPPMVRDEDRKAAVMIMVPCYNESDNELRKTIDSVLANDYPDENRVLVVVADGVITGRGETKSCPATLGEILGFQFDPHDDAYAYESVGAVTTNYASVYSGIYSSRNIAGKELKYIVVVKQGSLKERGMQRAGNRGKRDSQLLLFGILNRVQYNRRATDLDVVFMDALQDISLSPIDIEYLMAIDADTRVSKDALKFFVHKLEHDNSVLACCGETQVDNKTQSFITMIQVRIIGSTVTFFQQYLTSRVGYLNRSLNTTLPTT